jgi:GxxExxY protein
MAHRVLGPGLLESVYRECLTLELKEHHLSVERERRVPLAYKGQRIRAELRVDLVTEGRVVRHETGCGRNFTGTIITRCIG